LRGKATDEIIFDQGQFATVEIVVIAQADLIDVVRESPEDSANSAPDIHVSQSHQPADLAKTVAMFQVHLQQGTIFAGEQMSPRSKGLDRISILMPREYRDGRLITGYVSHSATPIRRALF